MVESRAVTKLGQVQAPSQPQPVQKHSRAFNKGAWDRALNFEVVKSFLMFSSAQPHLVSKEEIIEALQAAREILPDPGCNHEEKREMRCLLFSSFAKISIATHDEEVRREAEKARDSIPYPFGPKYGRVLHKP